MSEAGNNRGVRASRPPSICGRASTTRREFLRITAGMAAALRLPRIAMAGDAASTSSKARSATAAEAVRVVRVSSRSMMPVRVVQPTILREALGEGIKALAGTSRVDDAWHKLLSPEDIILVKFNQSGADPLGTSPAMAGQIVASLTKAGFSPRRLMLLEAPAVDDDRRRELRRPDLRWQGREVHFGESGQDSFIAALDAATAIINVPFLKTHHLAAMSGCLKNLSHGLIRHPARFHANGCDPAIGEIVASRPIREKLRLNIVNGLRVVFDGGPDAVEDTIHTSGTLLFGTDPVACDSIGYGLLNEIRAERELSPLLSGAVIPAQLHTAMRLGVGEADSERIETYALTL